MKRRQRKLTYTREELAEKLREVRATINQLEARLIEGDVEAKERALRQPVDVLLHAYARHEVMEMCLRRVWEIVGTETWDKLGELEAET
jgi:hypothetical protein